MVAPPPKTAPRLFLIDGYALVYRAYFAFVNRPLTNSRGENTSAAWGITNFLIRIREEYEPDYLAVVFDAGRSHREKEYPEYKATREKMPEDLAASLPRIRELIEAFNTPVLEVEGYEADDVIGTLTREGAESGLEVVIVSGDKDFYQLVGPRVRLLNPGRGGPGGVAEEWVDEARATEKMGLPPSQVVDYLALVGDTSDNVPGAPGVGPKTAVKLLEEYGTLDRILENAEQLGGKRARTALTEGAEIVRLSRRLVTIKLDVPVIVDRETLRVQEPNVSRLRDLLIDLEFRTLLDRFPEAEPRVDVAQGRFRFVESPEDLDAIVKSVELAGAVALVTARSGRDPMQAELWGVALAVEPGESCYVPAANVPSDQQISGSAAREEVPAGAREASPFPRRLVDMLESPRIRKIGHDLKADFILLRRFGIHLEGVWADTMVASYVLDPGRRQHSLEVLTTEILGRSPAAREAAATRPQQELSLSVSALEGAWQAACEEASLALELLKRFGPDLESGGLEGLFHDLEMPLVPVLGEMEFHGIGIDAAFFQEMNRRLHRDLALLQKDIHALAGVEFNLNSTPQLREILFDRLGLPVVKRTKTGPSTDVSVLEELADLGHEIPRLLIEYRQLEKLRSTYVEALPKLVNPETGRIHTSFNQAVAATGRLSSSEPNLQNIPIRTDVGREIRKGFVPDEGYLFLSADYSQIELRVLAHFSEDPAFLDAFRRGVDIHRQTASVIFDAPVGEVTSEMRARAKTINFATLYGQGDFSTARQLGISRAEAREFIDEYFRRFSGVRAFLDRQVDLARDRGYVETLAGRRRYVPELRSKNWNLRQFGERVAQNTPIQGTAADLIKHAMIDVNQALKEGGWKTRLLLQVHDELLFEVAAPEMESVGDLIRRTMESAMELRVPLVVDIGVGKSWFETKG